VEETLGASSTTSVPIQRFRVSVVRGPDAGREASSQGDLLVVGKAPGVQLLLSDPLVSRFHLELQPVAGGVEVRDLGSKNGSFVGPVGFHRILLQQDTVLTIGKTSLLVEPGSMQGSLELSNEVRFGSLWGDSQAMRRAFHLLRRAAQVRSPVLLRGEVGTGKHEAARSLHAASNRADGEFILFDCAAVPGPQVEQELLGSEGALAAARGGTLFLHEVGDLPAGAQARLSHLLERPEGQAHEVRVISASSQDLQAQVNRRAFRPELYYRLAAVTISLPPLRERREDIAGLVVLALQDLRRTEGLALTEAQQRALIEDAQGRSWPGNLRELRAFVEHAAVLGGEDEAPPTPAPSLEVNPLTPLRDERERWSKALERQYLTLLLEHMGWNVVAAARSAGVEREYIHRLIKRHGLQRPR
jgi:DNA-binding NtrC family response regulator